jgi:hypothetical protein
MRPRHGWAGVVVVVWVAQGASGQPLAPPSAPAPVVQPLTLITPDAPMRGPRIQFAELVHDFGEIQAGETIKHTFLYTNTGLATLEIQQVRTSCGCTTAGEWDRRIEPGEAGKIPIQFSSANFSGPIQKTVTVVSNDPKQGNVILQVKAQVWVPVEVTPKTVMFQYDSESPVEETRTIRIISNLKEPLKLLEPRSEHPAFGLKLETVSEGKEYALMVSTVPPIGTGMITAPIVIQASDTNVQPVRVQAYAVERRPIMISPSQLLLPAGPMPGEMRPSFSIRTQTSRPLVLSEASINIPGVTVEVKELQPGRLYSLTPTFPAGFSLPTGQRVEVSVKSDHPKHPVIRVPVVQPRQAVRAPVVTSSGRPLPVRTNQAIRTVPSR